MFAKEDTNFNNKQTKMVTGLITSYNTKDIQANKQTNGNYFMLCTPWVRKF